MKILKVVLTAAVMLTTVIIQYHPVYAAEPTEAIRILHNLNILPDESFDSEEEINQTEFSDIIENKLGLGQVGAEAVYQAFPKKQSMQISAYPTNATIQQDPNEFVAKEITDIHEKVTYEQAFKVILTVLGYNHQAEYSGGYPFGYMSVAREKRLDAGIQAKIGTNIKKREAAQLIYNAVKTDIATMTSLNKETFSLSTTRGVNILSVYLGIEAGSGQVTAVSKAGLVAEGNLRENEVKIDGDVYQTDKMHMEKYLGYYVEYFIREESNLLLYAIPQKGKNNVLTIDSNDIINADIKTIEYNEGGRRLSIDFSPTVKVLYNGKALAFFGDKTLQSTHGRIIALDNNNDYVYDVIFIEEYETFKISSISEKVERINLVKHNESYKKYFNKDYIQLGDTGTCYRIYKNNKETELNMLKANDIIMVMTSEDRSLIYIYATDKVIEGAVNEIDNLNGNIIVNENLYKIGKDRNGKVLIKARVGEAGKFYFNADDLIVSYSCEEPDYAYGFLFSVDKANIIGQKLQFNILSSDGIITKYYSAEKMLLNFFRMSSSEALNLLKNNTNQLIMFSRNTKNEITGIQLAEQGYTPNIFSLVKEGNLQFISSGGRQTIHSSYLIDNNTLVFSIYSGQLKEKSNVIPGLANSFRNGSDYYFKLYDVTESGRIKVVVVYFGEVDQVLTSDDPILIFDKITCGLNDSEEAVYYLKGYYDSRYVSYELLPNLNFTNLFWGDLLHLKLDSFGRIGYFSKLFEMGQPEPKIVLESGGIKGDRKTLIAHGYIERVEPGMIWVRINEEDVVPYIIGGQMYWMGTGRQVFDGTDATDLMVGDEVYIKTKNNSLREVWIIR
ncbi:MAG: hypothetical protein M0R40_09285 [Firmicutes bacterium]|nr:hypothetical protein [Bacillota bacterium]